MDSHDIETRTHDLEPGSPQAPSADRCQYERLNMPPSPCYDNTIKPALLHRPWVENLDQFIEPTTQGFGINQDQRMDNFDVKVIHILKVRYD